MDQREALKLGAGLAVGAMGSSAFAQDAAAPWPPPLRGARNGTVTLRTDAFLEVPDAVKTATMQEGAAQFVVARTAPTVDLAFHGNLGTDAATRRLWSSWGDIALARDGKVYCGIGDHGDDRGGDARCFLYRWDPTAKTLEQIVDMNRIIAPQAGQPAWSKVHARIDEGPDRKIYFSCTLNDGNRAVSPMYRWTDRLPGGQIYRYDPANGQTTVHADLPRPRCTATSIIDQDRNIWWCNLEGGKDAMWGLNLETKETVYKGEDGSVTFNRNFALGGDGSVFYSGEGGLWKIDGRTRQVSKTNSDFSGSPGLRSSTKALRDGTFFGTLHRTGQLFRYNPARDRIELFGPAWAQGDYTTVTELSPDEKFIYYLPGAHGGAFRTGTPVVQFEIATGRRKVLAFLAKAFEDQYEYVPAGTYGMKVSADGSTLYVNFNGHPVSRLLPRHLRPIGFGLTSFAAIHIPASER